MSQVASFRYVYFRIQSGGVGTAGLTNASFTIVFLRNNVACTDVLTITDLTGGLYSASYTPTAAGTDYLDIFEPVSALRATFTAEIEPLTGLACLTQTVTGLPAGTLNPQTYVLYIYLTSDWTNGNRGSAYAKGQTGLNTDGSWKTSIYVVSGVYTIVLINSLTTLVLSSNYTV
jgi:hypothetical protein